MAIEKQKSGNYSVRVKLKGKRITVGTFTTRKEAEIAQANHREATASFRDSVAFKEFIDFPFEYEASPFRFRVPAFLLNMKNKLTVRK